MIIAINLGAAFGVGTGRGLALGPQAGRRGAGEQLKQDPHSRLRTSVGTSVKPNWCSLFL